MFTAFVHTNCVCMDKTFVDVAQTPFLNAGNGCWFSPQKEPER